MYSIARLVCLTGQGLSVMLGSLHLCSHSRNCSRMRVFQLLVKRSEHLWEFIRGWEHVKDCRDLSAFSQLHIQRICQLPEVKRRWTEKRGTPPTDDDAERIYSKSLSATLDLLPSNSKMIRGVPETMNKLRKEYGVKIGSSTGYTSEIMAKLKVSRVSGRLWS